MSKLSPKERALLDMARKGWGPSASVKRAVRAGIPARLRAEPTLGTDAPGPGDVTSSAGRPAFASSFARSPWGVVTGLAVVGLCVAFAASGAVEERPPPSPVAVTEPVAAPLIPSPPLQASEPDPVQAAAPKVASTSLPEPPPRKIAPPVVAVPRPSVAEPVAAPAAGADSIAEEVALVRAAQKSLRDGAPSEALASLSTHASRFPTGALREERMTLQVLALCALGDLPKARSVRAELERLTPASSHLRRLACAAQ